MTDSISVGGGMQPPQARAERSAANEASALTATRSPNLAAFRMRTSRRKPRLTRGQPHPLSIPYAREIRREAVPASPRFSASDHQSRTAAMTPASRLAQSGTSSRRSFDGGGAQRYL